MRPTLEVADIFRRHGDAFRRAHASHLGRVERRVMAAIEACRTDALGGHTEQCGDCGLVHANKQGVRPWLKPWNADHAAGRITRALRHNGIPYKGINVVMLWSASVAKGYACPLWLTFKQAIELGGHVKKGETGELVVYADRITHTETDAKGAEVEKAIPFLKGYTVFNAEQCEGLPAHYTAKAEPPALTPLQRIDAADRFFAATGADIRHGGTRAYYCPKVRITCRCRPSKRSGMPRATPPRWRMNACIMPRPGLGDPLPCHRPANVSDDFS